MRLAAELIFYAVASLAVAVVWASVATLWNLRDMHFSGLPGTVVMIFGLVASVAALPAFLMRIVCKRFGCGGYQSAMIGGSLLGGLFFIVFFAKWISDGFILGLIELVALGGGLGLVGDVVFMGCHKSMLIRSKAI